jgi:hypothetical protein
MTTLSVVNAEYRTEKAAQGEARLQTPEEKNWYGACFIFIPVPSSLLRLSLLAFD